MSSYNPSILTIGSASRDIFIDCRASVKRVTKDGSSVIQLEEGAKLEVTSITEAWGGGAINAALCLTSMGMPTTAFFTCGKDYWGTMLIKALNEKGIDSSLALSTTEAPTAASFIIESSSGNNPLLNFRGANEFLSLENLPSLCAQRTYEGIYIAPLSGPCGNQLTPLETIKKPGQLFLHNPSMHQIERYTAALLKQIALFDVLLVNKVEAEALFAQFPSHKCITKKDQSVSGMLFNHFGAHACSISCFFEILHTLGARLVVVTNGKEGVYAATPEETIFVPSKKIELINAVGAGDTFGATLMASLLQKDPLLKALNKATAQSAYLLSQKDRPGLFLKHDVLYV